MEVKKREQGRGGGGWRGKGEGGGGWVGRGGGGDSFTNVSLVSNHCLLCKNVRFINYRYDSEFVGSSTSGRCLSTTKPANWSTEDQKDLSNLSKSDHIT